MEEAERLSRLVGKTARHRHSPRTRHIVKNSEFASNQIGGCA